jgi:hypothetical protein
MNIVSEQELDILFSKHAKLQTSLHLVNSIRNPVVRNSPLLLAASQVRQTVCGFLGCIDNDNIEQLSAALDEASNILLPQLHAFLERQRGLAFDSFSRDSYSECFQGIPGLDEDGFLPPGMHHASWHDFVASFAQTDRRYRQAQGLLAALLSLQGAGCKLAHVGGSFVTAKEDPTDIDYVFEPEGMDMSRLEPMLDRGNYLAHRQARNHYGIDGGVDNLNYVRSHLQRRPIFQCDMMIVDYPELVNLGRLPRSRMVGTIALDLTLPLPAAKDFSPGCMWDDFAHRQAL